MVWPSRIASQDGGRQYQEGVKVSFDGRNMRRPGTVRLPTDDHTPTAGEMFPLGDTKDRATVDDKVVDLARCQRAGWQ